jgi:hypothetical protein
MSEKVYMGPLLGWVEPTLRAVDERCAEVVDAIVRNHDHSAEHPLWKAAMKKKERP